MGRGAAQPTSLCNGRFDVLRLLGAGAYGEVYEAFDRDHQAHVAVKRLTRLTPEALLRFKREFRAAASVQHPNLVHLGELLEDDGEWLFTMELVHGETFLDYVRPSATHYDEARLRDAMVQLAEGLKALHDAGRVHRDVKPGNVLVTHEGRLVLLDLGLVTEQDSDRKLTGAIGTPAYMAPEQARATEVTSAADWYAMGVLLFEALTGTRPFEGSSLVVMVHKQTASPIRPSERTHTVPADLDGLCVALLAPDPDDRPAVDDILRVLRRSLRKRGRTTHPPPSDQFWIEELTDFVGRANELSRLQRMWSEVQRGRLAVVHISGESGMGKSALVHRFLQDARTHEPRTLVLRGSCPLRESLAYKAFDGVIDSLAQKLGALEAVVASAVVPRRVDSLIRMFPVLASADVLSGETLRKRHSPPANLRDEGRAALRELLERLGGQLPLVLVIDDIQWADPDSLALLRVLLTPPDPPPLLLIVVSRPIQECEPEVVEALEFARAAGLGEHLELAGLPPEEARIFIAGMLGPEHAEQADAYVDEAGGHPLFLTELAEYARHGTQEDTGLPRLEAALQQRVAQFAPTSQRLLHLLAVADGPLHIESVCAAAQLPWEEADRALKGLCLARLSRTATTRKRLSADTYHARVRTAVVASLDDDTQRDLHARLADALIALEPDAHEPIAQHLIGADREREAGPHAALAARAAAQALAFERAARLFELALRLSDDADETRRRELLKGLGDVCSAAGHGLRAALAYTEAARGAERLAKIDLTRRAAEHFLRTGQTDRGLDASRFVVEALGLKWRDNQPALLSALAWGRLRLALGRLRFELRHPADMDPEALVRADALYWIAEALGAVDTLRSMSLQTAGLLAALQCGEPGRIARALGLAAAWRGMAKSGIDPRTQDLLDKAKTLLDKTEDSRIAPALQYTQALLHVFAMEPAAAVREGDEAERSLREDCIDAENPIVMCQINGLVALLMLGEFQQVRQRAARFDARARAHGNLFAEAMVFTTAGFMSHLLDDTPDQGLARNEALMARWSVRGFQLQHFYAMWSDGSLRGYLGGTEAQAHFDRRWSEVKRSGLLSIPLWRILFTSLYARTVLIAAVAEPASRSRRLALASKLARSVAGARRFPGEAAQALVIRAGIRMLSGDPEAARTSLSQAVPFLRERQLGMTLNPVLWRLGQLTGGDEGAAYVREAEHWAAQQGVQNLPRLAALIVPGF